MTTDTRQDIVYCLFFTKIITLGLINNNFITCFITLHKHIIDYFTDQILRIRFVYQRPEFSIFYICIFLF